MSTTAEIKGNALVITIPMRPSPTASSSGKTLIVASTGGFALTTAQLAGKPVSISVNATIPIR